MKKQSKEIKERLDFIGENLGKRKTQLLCKNSKAEKHFAKLLDKTPYYYIQEKSCYSGDGKEWCYIDFFIPCFGIGIEIDGKEHNTKQHKYRDIKKDEFLLKERKIYIHRITNEDCLKMDSVDVIKIAAEKYRNESEREREGRLNVKRIDQMHDLEEQQKRCKFDVNSTIYAYSKLHDKIYEYKNLYFLKKGIYMKYKDITRALNDIDNIRANNTFIFDFDKDKLQSKIDKYYDLVWDSKI